VFASWGSLGHVTVAEPGALVGFLGPRVYQALYNEPFPEGVRTAENLYRKGVIDGVVPLRGVRQLVLGTVMVLHARRRRLAGRYFEEHPPSGCPAGRGRGPGPPPHVPARR
jgi:acetyl-CoA carboxylase beta subunit